MRFKAVSGGVSLALALGVCGCVQVPASPAEPPSAIAEPARRDGDYVAPAHLTLSAKTLRTFAAPEADQGAAADAYHVFAIDNSTIAKYDRATGKRVAIWQIPPRGLIRHLNSCFAESGKLWCANSNYSLTPHGSSIEIFDTETMTHVRSHSLGLTEEGSLTWFDQVAGGWIAGFAHYDGNGGVGHKTSAFSSVVTFDDQWRRTGGWLLPPEVVARLAPHAASGGAIGPDGLLYVLGHDRPELYALARPSMGPYLQHVATISVEAEGQAFAWDPDGSRRIHAVDRRLGRILEIEVPPVDLSGFPEARRLERQ